MHWSFSSQDQISHENWLRSHQSNTRVLLAQERIINRRSVHVPTLTGRSECREDSRTPDCVLLIPEAPWCWAGDQTLLHVRLPRGVFENTDSWIPHLRLITSECLEVKPKHNIFKFFCRVENLWYRGMRSILVINFSQAFNWVILINPLTTPDCGFYIISKFPLGFPCGSDSKESACNAEEADSIPGREDPLEKRMTTHSRIFA